MSGMAAPASPSALREAAGLFLRLGATAFGGPAAHTALMHREVVRRRGWVDGQRFMDLVGATNLVPGPNSTELAIHLGHERAGWRGLLSAGVLFILPGAALTTAFAWWYVEHGENPALTGLLYGVVPVMIAIVLHALVGLARPVLKAPWAVLVATAALAAYLLGVNELVILVGGGVLVVGVEAVRRAPPAGPQGWLAVPFLVATDGSREELFRLFLALLKIGAVLYGSGYVLLAFLEGEFVDRLGWITSQQLVDAVSVGQATPGPFFTAATFVGYLVAGLPGAFVATVAIFLPAFVFVGLLTRITGRLRSSPWLAAALDGVNAASLALMAGVTIRLAGTAIVDPVTAGLALVTFVLLVRTRLDSTWCIAGGALIGVVLTVW